jgi:hypothetical protein
MGKKVDRVVADRATRAPETKSPGKAAYEARRAAEAGLSVEAWLKKKARDAQPAAPAAKKPARKGLISRLLDRAHKPL